MTKNNQKGITCLCKVEGFQTNYQSTKMYAIKFINTNKMIQTHDSKKDNAIEI